jgi:hypothetical protein
VIKKSASHILSFTQVLGCASIKLSVKSLAARSKLPVKSLVASTKLSVKSLAARTKLSVKSSVARTKLSVKSLAAKTKLSVKSLIARTKLSVKQLVAGSRRAWLLDQGKLDLWIKTTVLQLLSQTSTVSEELGCWCKKNLICGSRLQCHSFSAYGLFNESCI